MTGTNKRTSKKLSMKNIFFLPNKITQCLNPALIFLLIVAFISACKKDNYTELNKGNMPLLISTDKDSVVLKQNESANDAINITWTAGSNYGTNASISYVLEIDKQGNNFSNAVIENLGKAKSSRKYSVSSLNDLLIKQLGLPGGVESIIEARVIATVADPSITPDSSNTISIKVTPFLAVTETLYLIGDATPNGWSADNATAMDKVTDAPWKFTWTGNLTAGDFKFITTLTQFLPSYNKGADDTRLIYRSEDAQPDEKFHITEAGPYNVNVDLLALTITVTKSEAPPYSRIWIVGDATPNGWNIDAPNEMTKSALNPFVFKYNDMLAAGEFKMPVTTGNWGALFYRPSVNHPALTATDAILSAGDPDNKWQITTAGPYKIALDITPGKSTISILPFVPYTKIWLVGDATPTGWNIDTPTPMTADLTDPYIFTYTGPLTAGEFKIPLATGNFGCDYFMPAENHQSISSKAAQFVKAGNPDLKWQITDAGNYKIILNQLKETVDIIKQ